MVDGNLFASASWFDPDAVQEDRLIDSYADDGWLQGDLPVFVVRSWDCRIRIAVPGSALTLGR